MLTYMLIYECRKGKVNNMKYLVTYVIKANSTSWVEGKVLEAKNGSEAKKQVKKTVKAETGRNAFNPIAYRYEEGMTTEGMAYEEYINRIQSAIDTFKKRDAFKDYVEKCEHDLSKLYNEATAKGYTLTQTGNAWKVRK